MEGPGIARGLLPYLKQLISASVNSSSSVLAGICYKCTTTHFACPRARPAHMSVQRVWNARDKSISQHSAPISWGLCLLRKPQFFPKYSWDKSFTTSSISDQLQCLVLFTHETNVLPIISVFHISLCFPCTLVNLCLFQMIIILDKTICRCSFSHFCSPPLEICIYFKQTVFQKVGKRWFSDSNWDNNHFPIYLMPFNKIFNKCSIQIHL